VGSIPRAWQEPRGGPVIRLMLAIYPLSKGTGLAERSKYVAHLGYAEVMASEMALMIRVTVAEVARRIWRDGLIIKPFGPCWC
jgi:hypothetical protein